VVKIEVLAKTEYQDLYRVTDGVLLVINKFELIDYSNKTIKIVNIDKSKAKLSSYHKGCQKDLKILKQDYFDEYSNIIIPKGTVLYFNEPVIATDNQPDWTYEIKTTGNALSGGKDEIDNLLSSILYTIRTGEVRFRG
jgi:hypothetical protein